VAVEPLFNADKESLLKRVRIKTKTDEQTDALVDQVITEVRVAFYTRLGSARVGAIVGFSLVDNPTSENELVRANAANIEALWVTYLLTNRLPYIFMDNTGSVNDNFSDEPLTRDSSSVQDFRRELKELIDDGLGQLEEPVNTSAGDPKTSMIGAEEPYLISDNFIGKRW